MFALRDDEDTPENRRARVEDYLRSKYPERFPEVVDQGESYKLDTTPSQAPETKPPVNPEADRLKSLLERYRAAGDDSEVKDAEGRAKTARLASLFGDAFSTFATAAGRARGYQSDSGGYWNRLAGLHDPDVAAARQRMKDRQGNVLQEDAIEQAGVTRSNAEADRKRRMRFEDEDRARKGVLAGREDEKYALDQESSASRRDPNSPESAMARDAAKSMLPSGNFDGMSAEQLERAFPWLRQIMTVREQSEAKKEAARQWAIGQANAAARHKQDREDRLAKEESDRALEKEKLEKPKQVGVEEKARYDNVRMAAQAVEDMSVALQAGDNTFTVVGDNDFTESLRRFQEAMGRLQSGGAVTKDEEERFKRMAPRWSDSKEMQQKKLKMMRDELNSRLGTLGKAPVSSPGGQSGGASSSGAQVYSRGSIPDAD